MKCVDSVLRTDYENLRVVVIDNGSQDGTVEALKQAYADRIVLLENAENLRFSRGNDVGIEYALRQRADYVMLLNDNVKVDPAMIRELVHVAAERSQRRRGGAEDLLLGSARSDLVRGGRRVFASRSLPAIAAFAKPIMDSLMTSPIAAISRAAASW